MTDIQIEKIDLMRKQIAIEIERVEKCLPTLTAMAWGGGIVKEFQELMGNLTLIDYGLVALVPVVNDLPSQRATGRESIERIYCYHLGTEQPAQATQRPEWAISLGDNRQVILCELCAAKVSMDVVKELVREIRFNLSPVTYDWQRATEGAPK